MNKLKPEIRFKGFVENWEVQQLGVMAETFNYGLNAAATRYDGVHKYLRITDIDDDSREFNNDALTSPDTNLKLADEYKLKEGDLLFARTGASVGKTYFYKLSDGLVYFAGFLIRARIKPEYDVRFVFQNTLTFKYNNFIRLTSQRSGQPGVNAQEYGLFDILTPRFPEQTQIGNFFQNLDTLIAQHQKKYDKLLILKKAMLEKMFPKPGKIVPEIRFKGFSGVWSQYKLGDNSEIIAGGTPNTSIEKYWTPKQIPWMSSGEINKKRLQSTDNQISSEGLNNSSAKWIKKNSVLIALAGQGKTRGTVAINYIPLTTNQSIAAIIPNQNIYFEFLFQCLESRYEELRIKSSGDGTRGGLNKQIISDLIVQCPSFEEQVMIGEYFQNIDKLISNHQTQLAKLKNIKKACLEKMFV